MEAGKLRHLVTLQRKTGAVDTWGEPTDTWTDLASVWASIQPMAGREAFTGLELQALDMVRIGIRYTSGLVPTDRVNWNGRLYDILAIHNKDERNRAMELVVKEHK